MTVTLKRIDNDPLIGIVDMLVLENPTEAELEQAIADWSANTPMGQYYEVITQTPDEVQVHTSSDLDTLSVEDDGIEVLNQVDTGRSITTVSE